MKYSSRFWLYAPLCMFLALAAWAMGYWWVVAGALDKKLTALNGHEAVPGITVSYTSKTISGFPFNIDLVFTGFKIAGAGAHGPFIWTSERFALHRLTYGRSQDIYEAAGQQSVAWTDSAGKAHRIDFLPAALRASSIVDNKGLSRFDLDLVGAGGKDSDGSTFTIARAQFHLRRDPNHRDLDVMCSMDDWNMGKGPKGLEGLYITGFRVYANFTRAELIAPLLRGEKSWPDAVADWRAHGGMMKPDPQKTQVRFRTGQDFKPAPEIAAELLTPFY